MVTTRPKVSPFCRTFLNRKNDRDRVGVVTIDRVSRIASASENSVRRRKFTKQKVKRRGLCHTALGYSASIRGANLSSPFCRNVTASIFPLAS